MQLSKNGVSTRSGSLTYGAHRDTVHLFAFPHHTRKPHSATGLYRGYLLFREWSGAETRRYDGQKRCLCKRDGDKVRETYFAGM